MHNVLSDLSEVADQIADPSAEIIGNILQCSLRPFKTRKLSEAHLNEIIARNIRPSHANISKRMPYR